MARELPPMPAWRGRCALAPVSVGAKALCLVLDSYMDGACRAQVSVARLAADLGADRRTVHRWVAELEEAGLLGVDRSRGHHVNRYQGRPYGGTSATVNRGTSATVGRAVPWHQRPVTVAPAPPELEGQKPLAGAGAPAQAAPPGWVPEDDSEIRAVLAQREAERNGQGRTEVGWANPEAQQGAHHAADQFREGLRAEAEADARRRQAAAERPQDADA